MFLFSKSFNKLQCEESWSSYVPKIFFFSAAGSMVLRHHRPVDLVALKPQKKIMVAYCVKDRVIMA